jgi:hypothetical protein
MFNKDRLFGAAAGVSLTLLTGLAIEKTHEPARARAERQAQTARADALIQAEQTGFKDAVCRADAERVLVLPPGDREVLASLVPFYEAVAECSDTYRNEVANRRYNLYLQRGY